MYACTHACMYICIQFVFMHVCMCIIYVFACLFVCRNIIQRLQSFQRQSNQCHSSFIITSSSVSKNGKHIAENEATGSLLSICIGQTSVFLSKVYILFRVLVQPNFKITTCPEKLFALTDQRYRRQKTLMQKDVITAYVSSNVSCCLDLCLI